MTAAALLLSACKTLPPPPLHPELSSVRALTEAIAADARRSDHESDSKVREALAADAGRDAEACLAQAPHSAACLYYRGVALGLAARAHPMRASDLLKSMLEALSAAAAVDPAYDQAGPERVRALVLIRAPGWPLGPGDPEAGLEAARRAVTLAPHYPPNLLALAEALEKSGEHTGSQESYRNARAAADLLPASVQRDEWRAQADAALKR